MPLYEYECEAGHHFEKILKFSDPPIETCPTCGQPVRKLVSSPAFHLKGTGWYITDYAKKDKDTKDTKDTKEAKDTKETSGESKGSSGKDSKDSKETSTKETPAAKTSDTSSSTATPSTSAAKDSSKGT
jgi:putative FmdB family regulatory protein